MPSGVFIFSISKKVEMKEARRRELTQLGKVRKYFHLCDWNMNNSVICGGSREGF